MAFFITTLNLNLLVWSIDKISQPPLPHKAETLIPSDGVDRDSGGESGRQAQALIQLHCPDPPHLTVS